MSFGIHILECPSPEDLSSFILSLEDNIFGLKYVYKYTHTQYFNIYGEDVSVVDGPIFS